MSTQTRKTFARLTVGFTQSDRAAGYLSFDGYCEGAAQDEYTLIVPDDLGDLDTIEAIAEELFIASNSPEVCTGLTRIFQLWIQGLPVRSLSVGDTVTLEHEGRPAQMVACESCGWKQIPESRQPWRRCSSCGGVCRWAETAWTCTDCGDEWTSDHDVRYAAPGAFWIVKCHTHEHRLVSASSIGTTWTDDADKAHRYATHAEAAKAAKRARQLDHDPYIREDDAR